MRVESHTGAQRMRSEEIFARMQKVVEFVQSRM